MKYKRIDYPDGQISVEVDVDGDPNELFIHERINSYKDLFYVMSIVEAARSVNPDIKPIIYIPCMFGQRSDRRFKKTQSFDLKVISSVLNACNFRRVEVYDPHSDVTLALLDNSEKISSYPMVSNAYTAIILNNPKDERPVLVSPDAGAYKKVFEYGEKMSCPVVAAVKHRSQDGTVDLTFMGDVKGKNCLIVDDLCDGGYTFLVLAKALREQGANKVYLYVSHGYFSKGYHELRKVIDHIYCTNSVDDIKAMTVTDEAGSYTLSDFLTQFKII